VEALSECHLLFSTPAAGAESESLEASNNWYLLGWV
jgi:hypothetical protein